MPVLRLLRRLRDVCEPVFLVEILARVISAHHPEVDGLDMDARRRVAVEKLIAGVKKHTLDRSLLERIAAEDNKGRYRFSEDHSRIRYAV